MSRYRTYKNGITGKKYKDYYIVKEDTSYSILAEDKEIIASGINDYEDSEWYIDKMCATESQMKVMKILYTKEIFWLTGEMMKNMDRDKSIKQDENTIFIQDMVVKIRSRKCDDKPF